MLKYLSILAAFVGFTAGSPKTTVSDATDNADPDANGKFYNNDRPDRCVTDTCTLSEANVRGGEIVEPTLHDDYSPHDQDERDKKAARFAIECYLAQQ